jgi:NAD(P)H-nitrite reductase large subunit
VIGGGLLGLEAANGLLKQGMEVTVIHDAAHLMNRQLDSEASHHVAHATWLSRGMRFCWARRRQRSWPVRWRPSGKNRVQGRQPELETDMV